MSATVAMLDALRKKPVAEKKKEFSVAFFVANAGKVDSSNHNPKQQPNNDEDSENEEK